MLDGPLALEGSIASYSTERTVSGYVAAAGFLSLVGGLVYLLADLVASRGDPSPAGGGR